MDALTILSQHPQVVAASTAAREALEQLRWHQALRKRAPEVAAEARVQSAQASATLEGAMLGVDVVRQISVGTQQVDDGVGQVVNAVLQVTAQADHYARHHDTTIALAPAQAFAGLHTAAAAGLHPSDQVGRPRRAHEPCLDDTVPLPPCDDDAELVARQHALWQLPTTPADGSALVVAGLVWAEILAIRAFPQSNGLCARAAFRMLCVGRGLDPLGVGVPEVWPVMHPGKYGTALQGYCTGDLDGVVAWLQFCSDAVVHGAKVGYMIADSVLAGRFPQVAN